MAKKRVTRSKSTSKKAKPDSLNPLIAPETLAPKRFPLPKNQAVAQQIKEAVRGRENKKLKPFIQPENSDAVLDNLPKPGYATHLILRGDFVIGDFLERLIARRKSWKDLYCSTLSLNPDNVRMFDRVLPRVKSLTLLISSYFVHTDKAGSIEMMDSLWRENPKVTMRFLRTHAKILLLESGRDRYSFETSGNLRSSGCIEQMTIFNCPDVFAFHRDWIARALEDATDIAERGSQSLPVDSEGPPAPEH